MGFLTIQQEICAALTCLRVIYSIHQS